MLTLSEICRSVCFHCERTTTGLNEPLSWSWLCYSVTVFMPTHLLSIGTAQLVPMLEVCTWIARGSSLDEKYGESSMYAFDIQGIPAQPESGYGTSTPGQFSFSMCHVGLASHTPHHTTPHHIFANITICSCCFRLRERL